MSVIRDEAISYKIWGKQNIDPNALKQMQRAARLPIASHGALMPDAHSGYGLPIGGVLATKDAVIPYAVGMDIACRVRLTIFDTPPHILGQKRDKFRKILESNTHFGTGRGYEQPHNHAVMDDDAFQTLESVHGLKDKAWRQLGTSGSGNHFVEFGALTVHEEFDGTGNDNDEGSRTFGQIPPGKYLALLSHSGSRGLGFQIAEHFTALAISLHPELPKDYQHLAWLDMNSHFGQEYWRAMQLSGRYASANHAVIHNKIIEALRLDVLGGIENHHNFAWEEEHNGETLYVHRKGATPAAEGVFSVIPGTMRDPGFVVRGKGNAESLNSAAHGAGRQLSRVQAIKHFEWDDIERQLKKKGVELLAAGLDEAPGAYKDIQQVMAAQSDLVETLGEFQPLLVKMDGAGKGPSRKKNSKGKYKRKGRRQRS
jgi:tRNA-splicing ligase RtcB (3'-phosphate/5'-hydroxy nucleic acid ligase)